MVRFVKPVKRRAKSLNTRRNSGAEQIITTQITVLDHTGLGVAAKHAPVVFVEGALPGETVKVAIASRKKHVWHGQMLQIETSNSARQLPFCQHSQDCGGCQLDYVEPEYLRQQRKQAITQLLAKIAGVKECEWEADIFAEPLGYRRKARLAVDVRDNNDRRLGYRRSKSNEVFKLHECAVLAPEIERLIQPLQAWVSELQNPKPLGHITLFSGDNQVLVHIRAMAALASEDTNALIKLAEQFDCNVSIAIADKSAETLHGDLATVTYSPGDGIQIPVGADDFVQVNARVNQHMVAQVAKWLAEAKVNSVLDLFCGTGNFSLLLANRGFQVRGVEGVASMVTRAQQSAEHLALKQCSFDHHDLLDEKIVQQILREPFDAVLLDPSREGAPTVCAHLNPQHHPIIVYVSCNPASFARDAKQLIARGYQLQKIRLVEMFAYTKHCELMAVFHRS
ncbi:23S rRNA (uracil(1939)-C(5))-methyltransferase RlmD [Alteromonas flava]|uniref:23S rRNA (uracil(1939)-C(5))-methyltransferase RlmD n=1 Tax=Alteromonas flava TaxID=2048003 RepID=UPI000C2891F7|nr:23S rRNA (uracil(1939)-C(5))-methyltransferase RlmD [Alteromonas flava]